MVVALTETIPTEVRIAGFSLAYSLATALFGGFTPLVSTRLRNHRQQGGARSLARQKHCLAGRVAKSGAFQTARDRNRKVAKDKSSGVC